MNPQITLDSEDILQQLQHFIAKYACVLDAPQCKALADAMNVLIMKI